MDAGAPPGSPWPAVLVGAASFAVYASAVPSTLPGGDAGELIAAAQHLGVAHPPGYPLYTLAGHAFSALPFSTPAWRLNLFSAVCGAVCAGLVFATAARWTRSLAAGLTAAGLFAFAPLVFSYATTAEVFALNDLFVALLLWLVLRYDETGSPRFAVAAAGALGLGLGNHHMLAFFGLPLGVWVLARGGAALARPRWLLAMGGAGLLGAGVYLYLPLAAAHDPPIVWGDFSTPDGFFAHLLRREYGTFQLTPGGDPESVWVRIAAFGERTLGELGVAGVALALLGAGTAALRGPRRRFWLATAVAFAFYVLAFHTLANLPLGDPLLREVTARFWQQPMLVLSLWAGLGVAALPGPGAVRGGLASGLVALQLALGAASGAPTHPDVLERYGRALLEPLPPDAVLLTRGDLPTYTLLYLQLCAGVRPDVTVLDQALLSRPWYVAQARRRHPDLALPGARHHPTAEDGFSMRDFLDANAGSHDLYVHPVLAAIDPSPEGFYEVWPEGLVGRVEAAGRGFEEVRLGVERAGDAEAQLLARGWPRVDAEREGSWERTALGAVADARTRHGVWLLERAERAGEERAAWIGRALGIFDALVAEAPEPPLHVLRNHVIALARAESVGLLDGDRLRPAVERYLDAAPPDAEDRAIIEADFRRRFGSATPRAPDPPASRR